MRTTINSQILPFKKYIPGCNKFVAYLVDCPKNQEENVSFAQHHYNPANFLYKFLFNGTGG